MCGIAGVFAANGQDVYEGEIRAMCAALAHRGPDDETWYVSDSIGLGMRRLSIIDPSHGKQPVWNEDRSVCVILNGEIYNYRELRTWLMQRGHVFGSESDTEVIVHLYEEFGENCVDRLRGMFAFALWDVRQQTLLLVRDRLGVKPLFYGTFGGRLIFASELKAMLQLPDIDKKLNIAAVGHLFTFLTTPQDESVIDGVHKLKPGHLLRLQAGGTAQIREYWDVTFKPDHQRSEADTVEQLRDLLEESVRLCMVSDVPVGAFLSGGLDSSSVVALMSQQSDRPVETFSATFTDPRYDESLYALRVSASFNTRHRQLRIEPDVLGLIDDLAWYLDEPFGDSSAIPTYMVSGLAARHVKVVLSGDGGDEIFAGYDKYLVEGKERHYQMIPAALRRMMAWAGNRMKEGTRGRNFLRHIALDGSDRYLDAASLYGEDQKRQLFSPAFSELMLEQNPWRDMKACLEKKAAGEWLSPLQYTDLKNYLPLDILTKVDRMSMANSLEARVPLLDHKLVEYAATIPASMRIHKGSTKHIFKQAMRGVLPDSIIDRPKQGFAVPLGMWFRGELSTYIRDLLLSETSRARGIFNCDYIEKLLAMHDRGRTLDLQLWTIISFELWCRRFLDQNLVATNASLYASSTTLTRKQAASGPVSEILMSYSDGR